MKIVPYDCARFSGGAVSYAAQGICSTCQYRGASWMNLAPNGKATRAWCDECKPAIKTNHYTEG